VPQKGMGVQVPPRTHSFGSGLVALLTVAAIVLVLFLLWRFYIDTHYTQVLGTQVCER
jgi:hypothetical protein